MGLDQDSTAAVATAVLLIRVVCKLHVSLSKKKQCYAVALYCWDILKGKLEHDEQENAIFGIQI